MGILRVIFKSQLPPGTGSVLYLHEPPRRNSYFSQSPGKAGIIDHLSRVRKARYKELGPFSKFTT
jgi:hypothetical protein